jgi:hypothetical protein
MQAPESARSRIAESTKSVANAALWLQRVVENPESRTFAIERLEVEAARQLGELAVLESQYFDSPDAADAAGLDAGDEDLLATALSQLEIGNTLVAAGQTLGEGGTADPSLLDGAVRELRSSASLLETQQAAAETVERGFETRRASPDLAAAADRARTVAFSTLEQLAERSSVVIVDAFGIVRDRAPDRAQEALQLLGEQAQLGGEQRRGRLIRAGLKAIDKALATLSRIIPEHLYAAVRERVQDLWQRVERQEPGPAVVGWLIGVEGVRRQVDEVLGGQSLDVSRLDEASQALEALSRRFARNMQLVRRLVRAVAATGTLLSLAGLAIPHLALVIAGAALLAAATVVLLAMDYADTGDLLRFVPGVRRIIQGVPA